MVNIFQTIDSIVNNPAREGKQPLHDLHMLDLIPFP